MGNSIEKVKDSVNGEMIGRDLISREFEATKLETSSESSLMSQGEKEISKIEQNIVNDWLLASSMIQYTALVSYPEGKIKIANFDIKESGK